MKEVIFLIAAWLLGASTIGLMFKEDSLSWEMRADYSECLYYWRAAKDPDMPSLISKGTKLFCLPEDLKR